MVEVLEDDVAKREASAQLVKSRHDTPMGALRAQGGSLADFAEDLGRLLGQTERKASEWLGQRQAVATQLAAIRDKASELLGQLGLEGARNRQGRSARQAAGARTTKTGARKRKRKLSKETRLKMAEAARRRWAARKAASK
jgi:hypothetical protein